MIAIVAETLSGEVVGGGVAGGVTMLGFIGWLIRTVSDRTADLAAARAEIKEILVKSANDADARAKETAQSIAARAKADEAVAEAGSWIVPIEVELQE